MATSLLFEGGTEPDLVAKVRRTRAERSRGYSPDDEVRRDVLGDDRSGGDHGTLADLHSRKHGRATPDPGVIVDLDRCRAIPEEGIVHVVLVGQKPYAWRDADVVADPQAAASIEAALAVDDGVPADRDAALSVSRTDPDIQVGRHQDGRAFADLDAVHDAVPEAPYRGRWDVGDDVVRQVADELADKELQAADAPRWPDVALADAAVDRDLRLQRALCRHPGAACCLVVR